MSVRQPQSRNDAARADRCHTEVLDKKGRGCNSLLVKTRAGYRRGRQLGEDPRYQPNRKSIVSIWPDTHSRRIVSKVKKLAAEWAYDVVSIGYPGPVLRGRPIAEPHNLRRGWVEFDFAQAFGCPVKIVNDAALQALGSYEGGKMLFLGLGTGLGSAMIVEGIVEPMELSHTRRAPTRITLTGWPETRRQEEVAASRDVVKRLIAALQPDDTVIGGGNVAKLDALPRRQECQHLPWWFSVVGRRKCGPATVRTI